MAINLIKSSVVFDEAAHSYDLNGETLGGVTPIVSWMFPETYSDIPEAVLNKAAEHGTQIHYECRLSDLGINPESREATAYQTLKQAEGLTTLQNEWLVDDGAHIASAIDVIFTDGSIGDIKTTSKIHSDNVALQLSIYAYLLESMNPGLTVPRQCVIWLPRERYGSPQIMWMPRVPSEVVSVVLLSYLQGWPNDKAREAYDAWKSQQGTMTLMADNDTLQQFRNAEAQIAEIEKAVKDMQAKEKELRDGLLSLMEAHGVKSWKGEQIEFTYVAASTRNTVDSGKLKKQYPDVYADCIKTSETKSSIRIKVL